MLSRSPVSTPHLQSSPNSPLPLICLNVSSPISVAGGRGSWAPQTLIPKLHTAGSHLHRHHDNSYPSHHPSSDHHHHGFRRKGPHARPTCHLKVRRRCPAPELRQPWLAHRPSPQERRRRDPRRAPHDSPRPDPRQLQTPRLRPRHCRARPVHEDAPPAHDCHRRFHRRRVLRRFGQCLVYRRSWLLVD